MNRDYLNKIEVQSKLENAFNNFKKNDIILVEIGSSEWSMTHKLAEHLQKEFPNWNVDCEYNKEFKNIKRKEGNRVLPDIIIHHRTICDNLVAIEAKKDSGLNQKYDYDKLDFYMMDLNYKYGVFVCFNKKNGIDFEIKEQNESFNEK